MQSSGKLVIFGIVSIALAAAGTSWWFRYSATHRAAQYWGPKTARLIRDAPIVKLYQLQSAKGLFLPLADIDTQLDIGKYRDVSNARGISNLRNALLEDRSYEWPAIPREPDAYWRWALQFEDAHSSDHAVVLVGPDCDYVTALQTEQKLSSRPILDGLHKMFDELWERTNVSNKR
jgi:hypothetical protein